MTNSSLDWPVHSSCCATGDIIISNTCLLLLEEIYMHHAGSLYHEHIASESGVPSRYNTHEYCMRIEYENYGCEDCIWFKWWGESTDILISILGHLENTCNHIIIVYLRTQVNGTAGMTRCRCTLFLVIKLPTICGRVVK